MKTVVFLSLALLSVSCYPFGCREREERYFVDVNTASKEITFNRKLSECVNGVDNDDFAWQTLVVADAMVDDRPLELRYAERGTGYPYYLSDSNDDLDNSVFSFSINGQEFNSTGSEWMRRGDHIRFDVHPK